MITIKDHIQGMKKMYFNDKLIGTLTQFEDADWYLSFISDTNSSGFYSENAIQMMLNELKKLNQK